MEKLQHIIRLLFGLLTHTQTEREKEELEKWANDNPQHRQLMDRLLNPQYVKAELKRRKVIPTERPLADMDARIKRTEEELQKLSMTEEETSGSRRVWMWAASIVILLGIGTYWYVHRPGETSPVAQTAPTQTEEIRHGVTKAEIVLPNGEKLQLGDDKQQNNQLLAQANEVAQSGDASRMTIQTPAGGEFNVTLEDGTEVWLNADSRLIYPQSFGDKERRVEVEGEAYFKVKKDAERPFFVDIKGQEIKVYGTEFNVNTFGDTDGEVYTTLVNGKISLRRLDNQGGELVLTPGHQAVFDEGKVSVKPVDTDVVTSWRKGKFVFENQTLEQIMHILSRWYDFTYTFKDAGLKQTVFMGSIPRYGTFEEVKQILEMSGNIQFTVRGRQVIISR